MPVRLVSRLARTLLLIVAASSAAAEPMVLHRGTTADPPTLDPTLGAGTLASPIVSDMVIGLLARDERGRPIPGCAESWTVSEDGRIYTFRLRPDLRWSDGTPLTAHDFVYSYRRLMDPATGARTVGVFYIIENGRDIVAGRKPPETLGVSAPDDRTVEFQLNHRTPYFIDLMSNMQAFPVPRHVIEEYGRAWARPGRIVSNGAYVMTERVPQSYVKLEKNPHFIAADTVQIDEVYWHPTQDLSTSLKRFRAGDLDIVLNFPPAELEWVLANIPETLHLVPGLGTYFFVINMERPPFDDVRVRHALSLAIDRETLTNRILRTGVRPAYSFLTPDFTGYDGIRMPEQDLSLEERQAKARRLLQEAGFGPDNPLTVPLTFDTQEENRKVMVALITMWQAIGVRTEATNVDFGMLNRKVRTRDYAVARWFYIAPFDDGYSFLQLMLSDNPNNWPGYRNPDYDELLRRSNLIVEPAARQAILAEAELTLMTDYPVLPLFFYASRRLVSPRVKGWVDTPRGPTQTRYLRVGPL